MAALPEWKTESEGSYHILKAAVATWEELPPLFSLWWARLADLARQSDTPWDCLVADLWPDGGGRLIGHAQRQADAVGLDIGFRVCADLDLRTLTGRNEFDAGALHQVQKHIALALQHAAIIPPAQSSLQNLRERRQYMVFLTAFGEGPLTAAMALDLPVSERRSESDNG